MNGFLTHVWKNKQINKQKTKKKLQEGHLSSALKDVTGMYK